MLWGDKTMDILTLRKKLEKESYIFDEDFLITVHIALQLKKPLLIEGAAGVGKTEVAKILSSVLETELIRLQCYEGLDESKALYEWNYQKQLLSIQLDSRDKTNSTKTQALGDLFSLDYLLERPLLKAISSSSRSVLLVDEIDKTDEEFEAFLLEILSDFQISIPELGTLKAKTIPVIVLTSNNSRPLSDALKRRCAYLYIDYPSIEKEISIINARIPNIGEKLAEDIAIAVANLRENDNIFKKPSIAETLDWAYALMALKKTSLDKDGTDKTLGFILKNIEDITQFRKGGGFDGFFNSKHS